MVQSNERLGNYEIMAGADGSALVLGSGAGGITYRGRHVHLGTEVAVKVLIRRKNVLQKDRDAFLSEARSAASLTHPNIARILDFGESAQQHPYYVMELCEGGSLEEFGRKPGPPDDHACVQWLFESAAALAHAHRKGILHRDIKPSNLLIARQETIATVKLIDFGLANQSGQGEAQDHVIGTPHFAAPEQLRGQAEPASDVFSLGASFFWLLGGQHLSEGDVKNVISQRLEATGYGHLLAALPAVWQSVLGRMLEIDPTRRPQDGAELLPVIQAGFPHHTHHPVAWQESGESTGARSRDAPPSQWQDHAEATWADVWNETGSPSAIEHGVAVTATRADGTEVHDVLRFDSLAPEILEALILQGDLVARHADELGLGPVRLDRGGSWYSVAWPALGANDALSWVRQGQTATTAEILAALEPTALALDHLLAEGFGHLEVHPSILVVSAGPPLRFSLAVPLPAIAAGDDAEDSSGTMRGAAGTGLTARFASCVYQLLSGRTPPPAAFVNIRAFQAIPRLTERSNRFLASAIAGTLAGGTCRDVIRGLAHEERIPGASLSSGLSVGLTHGPRISSASPSGPSVTLPAAAVVSVPVLPEKAPPPPLPKDKDPVFPPPGPPPRKSAGSRTVTAAAIAAVVLLGTGGAAWFFIHKPPAKPIPPKPSETVSKTRHPESETPPAAPGTEKGRSLVRVPGDVPTVPEAIALCEPGGTVEVASGTYSGSIVATRPVSIVSRSAAILQGTDEGASVVTVRGPIEVTLRNIQIRHSGDVAAKPVESSPPLMLVTDSAVVRLDGCVIERSTGNGISLSDKSSAFLSNCRVRKNRGYGISASSGAKADITLSELQENGLAGIAAMNVGTSIHLQSGSNVSSNSRNGVEIANGAALLATGAQINENRKVGLQIDGAGTFARLEKSPVISSNHQYGIGVINSARLEMSDGSVEENKENGIYIETGGEVKVERSEFRSNGKIGIYLVNGAKSRLSVSGTKFVSHAEAAVAVVGGVGEVSGCRFEGNPMAVFFGKGASGSATGNTIAPGPLGESLVTEQSGEVSLRDNVLATPP